MRRSRMKPPPLSTVPAPTLRTHHVRLRSRTAGCGASHPEAWGRLTRVTYRQRAGSPSARKVRGKSRRARTRSRGPVAPGPARGLCTAPALPVRGRSCSGFRAGNGWPCCARGRGGRGGRGRGGGYSKRDRGVDRPLAQESPHLAIQCLHCGRRQGDPRRREYVGLLGAQAASGHTGSVRRRSARARRPFSSAEWFRHEPCGS